MKKTNPGIKAPMKRAGLIAGSLLILGVLTNVGVAWGCSLWIDVFHGQLELVPDRNRPSGIVRASRFSRPGAAYFEVLGGFRVATSGRSEVEVEDVIPAWTGLGAPLSGDTRKNHRGVDARGWPALAVWLEYAGPGSPPEVRGGIPTGKLRASYSRPSDPLRRYDSTFPIALPLRPRWPGFLINSIFYWLLLCALAGSVVVLRRHRTGNETEEPLLASVTS